MGSSNDGDNKAKHNDRVQEEKPRWHNPMNGIKYEPLEGDARILAEAYKTFSEGGITRDEALKLSKIDDVLNDASIQIVKNGGAVVVDSDGKATKLR